MRIPFRHGAVALCTVLVLLLAACGSDDAGVASSGDPAAGSDPSTDAGSDPTGADDVPTDIISLSPSATEALFAIGAGDQVVAVDSYSYYPEEAPVTDLSGYDPNVEAIVDYAPDLVIAQDDRNELVAGLAAVDIPVLLLPAATDLDDVYAQIITLGDTTGHTDEAEEVVETMQTRIDELLGQVPDRAEAPTYYHELGPELYSATSKTFIGELYTLAGLANIADAADPDGESFGYPQLSAELLLDADPDLVFLADTLCCDVTAASFGERPGFELLRAVRNGDVIELDDDIASRWGPRVVDLFAVIVAASADLGAAA